MAYLIKLPAVAADTSSGKLHQWLKHEGDTVAVGDALAELETEKAIVEINAEHAGILGRIVVPAGMAGVATNTILGVLLAEGEDPSAIDRELAGHGIASLPVQSAPQLACVSAPSVPVPVRGAPMASVGRKFSSPLARRLALQWNIDLATVQGTGPHGRVLRRDVEAARVRVSAAVPVPVRTATRRIPHTSMRRAIARRLTESKQQIPHFYLTMDCRLDALMALRTQANQGGKAALSINDFVVRAAALALCEVPEVNVSWHKDDIEHHTSVDVSVAVATDGGLVAPIVRDAAAKPLSAIATEILELASRARSNRLRPEELAGGSLTVSNLGMYGVSQFTAIINPPQAAILAVGAAENRPIVTEDGRLQAAIVMTVTLSADHRAVDGAIVAKWLAAFRQLIENPARMIL